MMPELASPRIVVDDDQEALLQLSIEQGWGDGFPLFAPTEAAVTAMLRFTDRAPREELGLMPPAYGVATVEKLAINAVMAGCRPEYFPLVVACVEALLDPAFNLYSVQTTTHPCGAVIIVSGPLAQELNINCRGNAFGQGWRANATIGRAIRLILVNVGGALPGLLDRATLGQPGKFSTCIAENEAESPWESWRATLGHPAEVTTVTVHGGEGPHNMQNHDGQTADYMLQFIGSSMGTLGSNHWSFGGDAVLVLSPEHAETLAREGLSKHDVAREVFQRTRRPQDYFPAGYVKAILRKRYGGDANGLEDGLVPLVGRPEDIWVLVAGGAGKHSMWVPSFGETRLASRVVALRDGTPITSIASTFGGATT